MNSQSPIEVYQFRFFLKGISPMIWRRILVSSNSSLADLHYAIQITMEWSDTHLHQFNIWGKQYGLSYDGGIIFPDNTRKVYLQDFQFRINEKFSYEYNFFDYWEHEIRLEKKVLLDCKKTYPLCIDGNYASPPEDCGGPRAFMELIDYYAVWKIEEKILEALEEYEVEKDHASFKETLKNLQYWASRHKFDRKKINRQLQRYFNNPSNNQLTLEEIQDED
ncbi:plasmid pRiA4b ORF-3 family protein [Candidatus Odyssella acanthamoebae]|uniref:plasmid pRiA4b ORF-3 family protein n=1 Tax=Candidatus Odyssella acanthamoebae TaxID=91604 RepID=UPI0006907F91|nr:plasmid pRiA4b ORF-3 family protein [Candidatus Paracaedibacter acanthamoebae]